MDKRQFSEQIGEAIKSLGADVSMGCMARSLVCLAHAAKNDLEFTCDQGMVSIERRVIPDRSTH